MHYGAVSGSPPWRGWGWVVIDSNDSHLNFNLHIPTPCPSQEGNPSNSSCFLHSLSGSTAQLVNIISSYEILISSTKNLKLLGYTKLLEHIHKWNHSAG